MKFDVITLFPDMLKTASSESILKRAVKNGYLEMNFHQLRDYSTNKHRKIDDSTYGGGFGLLMGVQAIRDAILDLKKEKSKVIYLSPRGQKLNHKKVLELSKNEHMILLCGHYEGVDQRVIDKYIDEEISIGDYVLTGGETAALVLIDSVSRYVDGVLGKSGSLEEESFVSGLLEYPQYTKPYEIDGMKVPDVLLSGNHAKINYWRETKSLFTTYKNRKDLLLEYYINEISKLEKQRRNPDLNNLIAKTRDLKEMIDLEKNKAKKQDFFYTIKENSIAQKPSDKRIESKLLAVDMTSGKDKSILFKDIIDLLDEGDTLVLNDSKVINARIKARKDTGAKLEIFLIKETADKTWLALVKPARKLQVNSKFIIEKNKVTGEVLAIKEDGLREIRFDAKKNDIICNDYGDIPLPPYIKTSPDDEIRTRYQNVYAEHFGSVAAPTAGLHFDLELLEKLKSKGVKIARTTLHVGLGTFRPVKTEFIKDHKMHSEEYELSKENARIILECKKNKKRLIAVGTTSVRVLESIYKEYGEIKACKSSTDIFIYPGKKFNVVDGLITNFHLPESTLIMLVSAFYQREKVLELYEKALNEDYRFFSFGDAMFLYK